MIYVSDGAKKQIKHIITSNENIDDNYFVRVSVTSGGCSGLSYKMGFVESAGEHDQLIEQDGVNISVDPKSFLYLNGVTVDFTDGLNGSGFTFNNPAAKRTCGCGSSFTP